MRRAAALAPGQVGGMIDLAKFLSDRGRVRDSDEIFNEAARHVTDVGVAHGAGEDGNEAFGKRTPHGAAVNHQRREQQVGKRE